jgi:hypothetical protein
MLRSKQFRLAVIFQGPAYKPMHTRLANTRLGASVKTGAQLIQYICVLSYGTTSCKATATAALAVLGSPLVRAKRWACCCCVQDAVGQYAPAAECCLPSWFK